MFTKALDRYLACPGEPYAALIHADRLRVLYGSLPIALLTSLVNAGVLGLVQSPLISIKVITAWVAAVALLTAWRFVGYYRFTRRPPPTSAQANWRRRFLVEVLLSGILWGTAALLLYPPHDVLHQMFLVIVLAGMGAGAVTTLSAMWSAALAYLIPALLPLIANLFFLDGSAVSVPMGSMAVLFLVMVSLSALRARNALVDLLNARYAQAQADADLRLAAITFCGQEGIMITGRAGKILRLNEAASRMTGYPEEALTNRPALKLVADGPGEFDRRTMLKALNDVGFWAGECRLLTRPGTEIPVRATVTAVHDEEGELSHYVGHFQDMSATERAQARIDFQTNYDALTAMPNRWLLSEHLAQDISRCRRLRYHGAVLFIDLDHFKRINDALGYHVGDGILKAVARRLLDNTRQEDLAAHFGGDEFVIVLTGLDGRSERAAEQAHEAADKLRKILAEPYVHNGNHLHLTASLGIALYPLDDGDAETVLSRADTALYRVKERGRDTQSFYRPGMQDAVRIRLETETALRRALDENQFKLVHQPQVDENGQTVGAESLLRWNRPGHGQVTPAGFIPIAEESGLILPIGDWVLRTAGESLARWRQQLPGHHLPPLSVNVSPRQFFQADFVERVLACLNAGELDGTQFELELTEGVLLDDIVETRAKMRQLAEQGIRFALDDFGTGYSSLRYLQQLPITTLKIDQSFVRDLEPDGGNAAIIRSIVSVARHLHLRVVAEGVETDTEAAHLNELGCHIYQGYRYSLPLEETEYLDWLRDGNTAVEAPAFDPVHPADG